MAAPGEIGGQSGSREALAGGTGGQDLQAKGRKCNARNNDEALVHSLFGPLCNSESVASGS